MYYPTLIEEQSSKDFIDVFGGYNHNVRIQDNEFYDMENLTSDAYPALSPRAKRGIPFIRPSVSHSYVNGMLCKDKLFVTVFLEGYLYLRISDASGSDIYPLGKTDLEASIERQLIMMGAYIVVLPDKLYFNTANVNDKGPIEANFSSAENGVVTLVPCNIDGEVYSIDGVSDTMPEDVWDGFVWLDTNDSPATLKKFTTTNSTWSAIATTYIRITCVGIGKQFNAGDGVDISGFTNPDTVKLNGSTIIHKIIDDDNIVVTGLLDTVQNKYSMSVKMTENVTEKENTFPVICDKSIVENELAGKDLIVGNKKMHCISNTTPQPALMYKIVTDDPNIWLGTESPTLEVYKDAIDATTVWVNDNDSGLNSEVLKEGCLIKFGMLGKYAQVTAITHNLTNANVGLVLRHPITVKAGTTIYPVVEYKSDTFYEMSITTDTYDVVTQDEKIALSLESAWEQTDVITISRKMPTLDFVIESNNRLWGCRYGLDDKGNFVNQIYASALGDFKNWSVFSGTSADSYFATVGTSGEFTGAVNYLGYPVFFKENCIHTIYGAFPAQYQINTAMCRGVQKGSHKSLAIVNEVLYYKSPEGVMAYTGSLPTSVSSQFGDELYFGAVSCAYKNKLITSMRNSSGDKVLFVYDTARGLWHKESGIDALQLARFENDVLYLTSEHTYSSLYGTDDENEAPVKWFAESGIYGYDYTNKMYITRMSIRMLLALGSKVEVYIQYNSCGEWKRVVTAVGNKLNSITLPIRPMRCDHFKLRIEGEGDAKIYSISKTIEQGSDL